MIIAQRFDTGYKLDDSIHGFRPAEDQVIEVVAYCWTLGLMREMPEPLEQPPTQQ